jgi:diguanylate cyclase (GGDEF)-like protein
MKYKKLLTMAIAVMILFSFFTFLKPYFDNEGFKLTKMKAIDNSFDVSKNILRSTLLDIEGPVNFYPSQLLTIDEINSKEIEKNVIKMEFPAGWTKEIPINYGTYFFEINGLEVGKTYGFFMKEAYSAFSLFVDGEKIYENGVVGTTKESEVSEFKPGSSFFIAKSEIAQITIHLSNYHSHLTGVWQKTVFGSMEQLLNYDKFLYRRDLMVIFALSMMSLYHWILYTIMRRDRTILYFSLFILLIIIKSLYSEQQLGYVWYPNINFTIGIKLTYLTLPLMCIAFVAFLQACFPKDVPLLFVKVNGIISFMEFLLILVTSQYVFQSTFVYYQFYLILGFLFIIGIGVKTIIRKRQGAIIYNIGFFSLFLIALNDIFYSLLWVKTGFYLGVGLFILILAQSAVIAIRFANALKTEERLKNNLETIVIERTEQLKNERNIFEHLSKVDSLTTLYNKRFLMDSLNIEFEGNKRYQGIFSVIMMDIDFFKAVNDEFGHLAGDEVLVYLSQILEKYTRRTDIVGRFGGEEFMILMRFTQLEDAKKHAENLRKYIEEANVETYKGILKVTASFGVSQIMEGDLSEDDVLIRADEALYLAKSKGRNQVQ